MKAFTAITNQEKANQIFLDYTEKLYNDISHISNLGQGLDRYDDKVYTSSGNNDNDSLWEVVTQALGNPFLLMDNLEKQEDIEIDINDLCVQSLLIAEMVIQKSDRKELIMYRTEQDLDALATYKEDSDSSLIVEQIPSVVDPLTTKLRGRFAEAKSGIGESSIIQDIIDNLGGNVIQEIRDSQSALSCKYLS